jgi:MFS superfamily sulfate permease-like transporter
MRKDGSLVGALRADVPASVVVFLVAVPLCLGIALASGAPLFSGIIAGIVGGLVVGALSGSQLGVSGPAAGLAVIVLSAITALGSFEAFLVAVVLAGVLQIAMGYARAGIIGYYFPSSVIKGMLAGIGLTIVLKQLPHAVGYDLTPEGAIGFAEAEGGNTFSSLGQMLAFIEPGAVLVACVALALLLLWERPAVKRFKGAVWIQGPLVAVLAGIALNEAFKLFAPSLALGPSHLVQLPAADGIGGLFSLLTLPDFSQLANPAIYTTAVTLAVVASIETLLCVEATDKLDPRKRVTPTNRELKAQGVGNIVSGLIGGLPLTQVIVRSSANIQSGAQSKLSAILHGALLLAAVVTIPALLNRIPLAVLASILFVVGYKLAKPALIREIYAQGSHQFAPFAVTVVGILATDLLIGIGLGMAVAFFIILLNNYNNPFFVDRDPTDAVRIELSEDVSFLNRAAVVRALAAIPAGSKVVIDASRSMNVDHDVYEMVKDFEQRAAAEGIDLTLVGFSTLRRSNDAMHRVLTVARERASAPSSAAARGIAA